MTPALKDVERNIATLMNAKKTLVRKLAFSKPPISGSVGLLVIREWSAINVMATLVHKVQKCWKEKKVAAALFMDVKGGFNHVLKDQLIARMTKMGVDGDLIKWIK